MIRHLKEDKGNYLKIIKDRKMGITTGFPTLDKMIYGINPAYHIIAARPSVGKTSIAMNMALSAAVKKKKAVFFSIEMPKVSFMERMVAMLTGVSPEDIRANKIKDDYKEALDNLDKSMEALDIYVDYASHHKPKTILTQLEYLETQMQFKPDIVFVDYIQYMRSDQNEPATSPSALTDISRGLAQIVKDLKLPIVVVAQLGRGADEYATAGDRKALKPKRPRLSDLKGSGAMEEDADVVILLHRDDYYKERESGSYDASEAPISNASIIVAKNRQGPCGSFSCTWLPDIFKFGEIKEKN